MKLSTLVSKFKLIIAFGLFLGIILINNSCSAQNNDKQFQVACISFYNIENLFDTIKTPGVNDIEFTPEGTNRWNSAKYLKKLENMADVISQIGTDLTPDGPAILGLSEIENRTVIEDLIAQPKLKDRNYQIVHYDSPDLRGVDVGLIYNPNYFKVLSSNSYRLNIPGNDSFLTRDQLLVSGELLGERIHVIVCHWPSRRNGEKKSRPSRIAAAELARSIIDSISASEPGAKVFLMGDLNDDPVNVSVKEYLKAKGVQSKLKDGDLFNPFEDFYRRGIGSLAWRDSWNLFDQIIFTQSPLKASGQALKFHKAGVFNKKFLRQQEGRFQGYPLRTYAGGVYMGGYSDHFPVYIFLIKEI
ncbi:MAG: endonuclease/exonuclease/phosphatase family protein [Bacteroidales bacterium]|nr:endonuclease/exonuclease/phosphatase family protein [Bacteroidales bacterium]